jgi:hypothetical protein
MARVARHCLSGRLGRSRDGSRLGAEHGLALPVAIVMLFVVAALGSVVAAQAVNAADQGRRDSSIKRAVASADAGIDAAIYRLNKLKTSELLCVVVGTTGLTVEPVQTDGWCRAQAEDLGDGASYSYRVSRGSITLFNGQQLLQRKIVSTGTANGVTRRVKVVVGTLTGISLFGGNAIMSADDLTFPNSTLVTGNVASNGNVSLSGSTHVCGNITYGPGKQFTTSGPGLQCSGYSSLEGDQPMVLNPVDQGNSGTSNDNGRIGVQDPFLPSVPSIWNPATRVLQLKQWSTLTLTGDVYNFCNLEIANSAQLIIAPRLPGQPPLKIFIDSPENCPGVTNAGSVKLTEQGSILNANTDSSTVQLLVAGSAQSATSVQFLNSFNSNVNMIIYAPRSTVRMQNSTAIVGAVAGKSVILENSASVTWNASADVTIDNLEPLFRQQEWVECTARPTSSVVDSGCS